jgi:hypothetical protein
MSIQWLAHAVLYQPAQKTIVPGRLIGFMRQQHCMVDLDEVVLCLDQSGSMASSIVHPRPLSGGGVAHRSLGGRGGAPDIVQRDLKSLTVILLEIFQKAHRCVDGKWLLGPGFKMTLERSPDRGVIAGIKCPVSNGLKGMWVALNRCWAAFLRVVSPLVV